MTPILPLPCPLQEWFNAQRESTPDTAAYKRASEQQIMFVRDQLTNLVLAGLSYQERRSGCLVISEHRSKSVRLPVYSIARKDIGLRVVLRENFYNWKLSVISDVPILADFSGLFYTTSPVEPEYTGNCLASCYFEGFPRDLIFGYYEEGDRCSWSAEIWGDERIWTTLFLMMRSLGVIKPAVWHTRASHAAELDAQKDS